MAIMAMVVARAMFDAGSFMVNGCKFRELSCVCFTWSFVGIWYV